MFLRHCSIDVQIVRYKRENSCDHNFIDYLNTLGGIGIYIRFDGATIKSFEGSNLSDEKWDNLFIHYFELYILREYLFALKGLQSECPHITASLNLFLRRMGELLGHRNQFSSLDELIKETTQRILEVSNFRGLVGFQKNEFTPTKPFVSQSLSFEVPLLIRESLSEISPRTNFILLVDEYENFSTSQQRMLNTLIKFVRPGLTFRIGMRRNGWRTYGTVNDDDFVKEGRDYEKFIFEEILHSRNSGYQDFLIEVARKRLESIHVYKEKGTTDIRKFLGKKEDLESEALEIVNGNQNEIDRHFQSKFPKLKNIQLSPTKSPLVRMLGYLWMSRGESESTIEEAISEYESGNKTEKANRLHYDLVNKYRLSLIIILSSIYRKQKQFYSFNTFSYLSSGIVGNFIELCRYTFRYAEFASEGEYVQEGISTKLQTKAAVDVGTDELQQVKRIEKYGNQLYHLVENLGGIFRSYHLDTKIRYPETNQFSLDEGFLDETSRDAFDSALMWSVIQKKPTLQSKAPSKKKTELYTLNRIFSPVFQISYRTRGGISEEYSSKDFVKLISEENIKPKKKMSYGNIEEDSNQKSIFSDY